MMHLFRFVRRATLLLLMFLEWLGPYLICLVWDHKIPKARREPPHKDMWCWQVVCSRCHEDVTLYGHDLPGRRPS